MLDLIVPVRPGANEELRYAARSWVANLPHRWLTTAGGRPDWLAPSQHLPVEQAPGRKHVNAMSNLRALLDQPGLTRDVIVANDDFFVIEPLEQIPTLHRGLLGEAADQAELDHPATLYTRALVDTFDLLQRWGIRRPLCYDLHVPAIVNRAALVEILGWVAADVTGRPDAACRILWRTVYGNAMHVGGDYSPDVKIRDLNRGRHLDGPFVSTDDGPFEHGRVGVELRRRFPEPSRYELDPPGRKPPDEQAIRSAQG